MPVRDRQIDKERGGPWTELHPSDRNSLPALVGWQTSVPKSSPLAQKLSSIADAERLSILSTDESVTKRITSRRMVGKVAWCASLGEPIQAQPAPRKGMPARLLPLSCSQRAHDRTGSSATK